VEHGRRGGTHVDEAHVAGVGTHDKTPVVARQRRHARPHLTQLHDARARRGGRLAAVPHPQEAVLPDRHEEVGVGGKKCHVVDVPVVRQQVRLQRLLRAAGVIPQVDAAVPPARGDVALVVRVVRDARYNVVVR